MVKKRTVKEKTAKEEIVKKKITKKNSKRRDNRRGNNKRGDSRKKDRKKDRKLGVKWHNTSQKSCKKVSLKRWRYLGRVIISDLVNKKV